MHKLCALLFITTSAYANYGKISPKEIKVATDTTITIRNSVSELFLDSSTLEKFILEHKADNSTAHRLRTFYNTRNYQSAWFTKDGLAEQTRAFWNLHNNYINYSKDSTLVDQHLHMQMEKLINTDTNWVVANAAYANTEFQLTEHFFQYAQYAYAGRINPSEQQWHIPRKKLDVASLLDSIVKNKGKNIEQWEPVSSQYRLMKTQLINYYNIDKNITSKPIVVTKKAYKEGESSPIIKLVKQRLRAYGDYTAVDTFAMFNKALSAAVKQAQKRFGLKQDGVIGADFIRQLNVPIEERIEQMLVNMERMRWMPQQDDGNRIVANIPEFKMHIYEDGKEAFAMNVVVGKAGNNTVIFNDSLTHIVFSPYWNVPESIVKNEIVPGIQRNDTYLARRNMERTGTSNGIPVIRQRPGGSNSLGRVKFLFPNSYAIYFHDTPSKSLFSSDNRAFSHGCVRLAEPGKLAEYLLRNRPEWTPENIEKAMLLGKEKWVTLRTPIPVVLSYFTCWVDDEGLLNFREDIYGHDKKMAELLFKK